MSNFEPYTSETDNDRPGQRDQALCPTDGDHAIAIPALTLHAARRQPDPALHLQPGLGVVAGRQQVLLGDEAIDYGPGQSMLTTIDLRSSSHVTRASVAELFLGMMLSLTSADRADGGRDGHAPARREDAHQSISFEALDAALLMP
jgi:hypothetical protein